MKPIVTLCITFATLAQAQPAPLARTTGSFFALSVADLKASAQWYSEKFGLKVALEVPKTNGAAVIVLEGS